MNQFRHVDPYPTLEVRFQENFFTPEECQKIIHKSDISHTNQGTFGVREQVNKSVRDTIVKHLSPSPLNNWIFTKIANSVYHANNEFYKFDLTTLSEVQLLEYNVGGFYDWHTDCSLRGNKGLTRKLSVVIFLTDPKEYEGGYLVLNTSKLKFGMNQGMMVIFPSFLVHKVEPVIKGVRHTLVAWVHGPMFK
jgi:PKHD-type hydroxylase